MSFSFRPLDPNTDYEYVAPMLSIAWNEPITREILEAEYKAAPPDALQYESMAVDVDGKRLGYGSAFHMPWHEAGRFFMNLVVIEPARSQGIGSRLYDEMIRFTEAHGATRLTTFLQDAPPQYLAFAQKRGWVIEQHLYNSMLDPTTFDEKPFVSAIQTAEDSGIHFTSLAEVGETEVTHRKLYDLVMHCREDVPGMDWTPPPFENYVKFNFESPEFIPDGVILAVSGDQWVGYTHITLNKATNTMLHFMTGVHRDYRGRKLGQALKLLSIRVAAGYGARELRTSNDMRNEAMLAINRKFGYQRLSGQYRLIKRPDHVEPT